MSIASEIARLQQAKADLKTAINAKGRAITDETIDLYAAEVDAIVVGGGGGATTGDFLVRFIDYDGTVLKEEWVDSGNDATPPTLPGHSTDCSGGGLTFQEWNNTYTNVTRDVDVGATYITTDGKTHALFTLTVQTTKDLRLHFNKSDGSTLTVDWGDGTQNTFTNTGSFNTGTHIYTNYGDYEVTFWISSGTGTYTFGYGSSTYAFLRGTTLTYSLTKLYIGLSVNTLNDYSFYLHYSITLVSIPNNVTLIKQEAFSYCRMIKAFIIPNTVTSIGNKALEAATSCTAFVLPNNLAVIGIGCFNYAQSLNKIILPLSLNGLSETLFSFSYGLEKIIFPPTYSTLGNGVFTYCNALKNIFLPQGIGYIYSICNNCITLEKVDFPKSLISIGAGAFSSCNAVLEYNFSNHEVIPTLASSDAFGGINLICKIKVPLALEAAWKAATNWSTYADYIVGV